MAQARKLLPLPVGPRIRTLLCWCSQRPLARLWIRLRSRPRSAVVDILEAGGLAQLGKAQTLGERGIVAFDGLAIDQHRQALVEAEAIAVGQALLLLERLGHAGEA